MAYITAILQWLGTDTIALHAYAAVGVAALYLISRTRKREHFSLLSPLNIKVGPKASPAIVILDLVVSSVFGSLFVTAMAQPNTNTQAITAGLGFMGLLTGLGGTSSEKGQH